MHDSLLLAKDFIGTLGFPVFVATLLLFRVEAWHVQNIAALNELRIAILDKHLAAHCKYVADRLPRPPQPRQSPSKRK
jgi:hypothetical protein